MNYIFTDSKIESYEFIETTSNDNISTSNKVANKELQTDKIDLKNITTQTFEKVNEGIQVTDLNDREIIPLNDVMDEVSIFLNKIKPMLFKELNEIIENDPLNNYNVIWEEERATIQYFMQLKHNYFNGEKTIEYKDCSNLAWNCTGSILAVSYGKQDHNGWCNHQSCLTIWSINDRHLNINKGDIHISLPSCLMCISFHPIKPSIIAGGLYNGEIRIWNISNDDEPLLMSSKIDNLFHREPITSITWVKDNLSNFNKPSYNLISSSSDGKILTWTPKNQLKYPLSGYITIPSEQYYGHGSNMNKYPLLGAISVAYSLDATNFIVGTEAGGILKSLYQTTLIKKGYVKTGEWKYSVDAARLLENCDDKNKYELKKYIERYIHEKKGKKTIEISDIYLSQPPAHLLYPSVNRFTFEPHSGPIYQIEFSPFHRNLFLTCSTDSTVRLYNLLQSKPIIHLAPSKHYLFTLTWSTGRPLVFAVADNQGNIYIYDLLADTLSPIHQFSINSTISNNHANIKKQDGCITSLQFSPTDSSILSACDINGRIVIWRLGTELSTIQPNEMQLLEKLGKQ